MTALPSPRRLAVILGLLSAIGPFAIDAVLPGLPQVASDLGVTGQAAAATLTVYFVSFGLAQLLWGPAADALGRRLPLAAGIVVFLLASVWCALAPGLGALVAARAVQAFGAATLMVVPRAVIRDRASGPEAATMMAAIMVVMSVSPMLAPLAGSLAVQHLGWRSVFWGLAAAAAASLALTLTALPETLPPRRRVPISLRALRAGAGRLLRSRAFMGLTLTGGFAMASFFVFLAAGAFVYMGQFGLTPTGFGLAFAVNALGFVAASQLAGRLGARLGMDRLMLLALAAFVLILLALAAAVAALGASLSLVAGGLALAYACLGLVIPTAMVAALDPHPDIAGLASSLGGTLQMLIGGAAMAVAAPFLDGTAGPMLAAIAACAVLSLASALATLRRA